MLPLIPQRIPCKTKIQIREEEKNKRERKKHIKMLELKNWSFKKANYPATNRYIEYELRNRNFHKVKDTRNDLNGAQAYENRTERHIKADVTAIFVAFIACT